MCLSTYRTTPPSVIPSKGRRRVYTYFGDLISLCQFPTLVTAFHITMDLTASATLILS